jgi:hypothetical protein
VPGSPPPIRTRDGHAIPRRGYQCEKHQPLNTAGELKLVQRPAIKDLIKESSHTTASRAKWCNETKMKYGLKIFHVQEEDTKYYGFILDTTKMENEDYLANLCLFDVST